jgi:mono/diheme cytochrome c family protein
LLWGRDNWIYGAAYETRFRLRPDGTWEHGPTSFRGQWGLSQDDTGHLFHNSNSDQLRGDATPANYLLRNPAFTGARGTNVKVATNQAVWPVRVNPGVNRGYQTTIIKPNGKLADFTAACSPLIYRGDAFGPEFYANAFVAEPAANLVKRNLVSEKNGTLTSTQAYPDTEFLASTDERFRPVFLSNGPDGALYVVDLYRGILQHRISLTTYLRNQIKERNLDNPIGLGRIYRIVPDGAHPKNAPAPKTTAEWVARLSHPNGWWRDLAQQQLVESRDPAATAPLRALARGGASPVAQVFALSTLAGRGEADRETVWAALHSPDAAVRLAAVRVSESLLRGETKAATLAELGTLKNDPAPGVELQLALTLGEAADPAADRVVAELVRAFPSHPFLADAAVSGVATRELALLEQLTADPAWNDTTPATDRLLGLLAACVFNEGKTEPASRALDALIAGAAPAHQTARLTAFAAAIEHGAAAPKATPQFAALLKSANSRVRTIAAKIADTVLLPANGIPRPGPRPLKPAERTLYEQGAILFGMNCAACHQADGKGRDGLAPGSHTTGRAHPPPSSRLTRQRPPRHRLVRQAVRRLVRQAVRRLARQAIRRLARQTSPPVSKGRPDARDRPR